MQAVKVQQTAASESAATVTKRKVKTFTDRLAEISIDLAEAYVIIDEKLTERGLMSRRSATTQSYSVARKAYAKLVLTAREMRLFVALKPAEASALCPAVQDVSQKKAYKTTPVMLALRTYEDVRNAVALINALNV